MKKTAALSAAKNTYSKQAGMGNFLGDVVSLGWRAPAYGIKKSVGFVGDFGSRVTNNLVGDVKKITAGSNKAPTRWKAPSGDYETTIAEDSLSAHARDLAHGMRMYRKGDKIEGAGAIIESAQKLHSDIGGENNPILKAIGSRIKGKPKYNPVHIGAAGLGGAGLGIAINEGNKKEAGVLSLKTKLKLLRGDKFSARELAMFGIAGGVLGAATNPNINPLLNKEAKAIPGGQFPLINTVKGWFSGSGDAVASGTSKLLHNTGIYDSGKRDASGKTIEGYSGFKAPTTREDILKKMKARSGKAGDIQSTINNTFTKKDSPIYMDAGKSTFAERKVTRSQSGTRFFNENPIGTPKKVTIQRSAGQLAERAFSGNNKALASLAKGTMGTTAGKAVGVGVPLMAGLWANKDKIMGSATKRMAMNATRKYGPALGIGLGAYALMRNSGTKKEAGVKDSLLKQLRKIKKFNNLEQRANTKYMIDKTTGRIKKDELENIIDYPNEPNARRYGWKRVVTDDVNNFKSQYGATIGAGVVAGKLGVKGIQQLRNLHLERQAAKREAKELKMLAGIGLAGLGATVGLNAYNEHQKYAGVRVPKAAINEILAKTPRAQNIEDALSHWSGKREQAVSALDEIGERSIFNAFKHDRQVRALNEAEQTLYTLHKANGSVEEATKAVAAPTISSGVSAKGVAIGAGAGVLGTAAYVKKRQDEENQLAAQYYGAQG